MGDHSATVLIIACCFAFVVYFLPAAIAGSRSCKSSGAIFALNLFLGWSFLGWVGALVWALAGEKHAEEGGEA